MHPSALIGGAIALAGLVMMAGWVFAVPGVVGIFPGFVMVFNTALGFAAAGAALAVGRSGPSRWRKVRTGIGIALGTLGMLVLLQHIVGMDIGIDWAALHTWMIEPGGNPFPGRMSPATGVGFLLAGAVLALAPRARGNVQVLAVRALTIAIAALGALSAAGYGLNLADSLEVYWLNLVSLPTAAGFLLLALALWLDWRGEAWNARRLIRDEEDHIAVAGALVLAGGIFASGIAVFWLMQTSMERVLSADLAFALKSRAALVSGAIKGAILQTANVAERPNIVRLYLAPSSDPRDPNHPAFLSRVAASLVNAGFSAFVFYDAKGKELARAGEFVAESGLRMPVTYRGYQAEISWDGNFMLQARADIVEEGRRIGEVRAEHRLAELEGVMSDVAELGDTSELAICALREGALHCAPTRFQPRPFDVPMRAGQRLPMSYALEGAAGVLRLTDYRNKRVLAAFAPLGAFGLGTVLKIDLAELYAPIRSRLGYLFATLLIVSIVGGWLLRSSVQPLARKLVFERQRLRLAMEGSRLALWDWDIPSGRIQLSEQWSALLGGVPQPVESTAVELAGRVHPEDVAEVQRRARAMLAGTTSHYDIEHRVRTDAGDWKWIRSRGQTVGRARDGTALRAIGTTVDIDERKVHELQLAHRAAHDVLTGLPNRGLFHDRLERALLRSRRGGMLLAVLYLDVDRFKEVNDTLGHAVGDALLREFSQRLLAGVRTTDTVARLGGDEFAMILEGLDAREDGLRIAGNIVAAMRKPFALPLHAVSVSTSVGIAFREAAAESGPEDLLARADRALYEAKSSGRDRFCTAA